MLYIQELSLFEYTLLLIFLRLVAGDEKASVTIVHRTSQ